MTAQREAFSTALQSATRIEFDHVSKQFDGNGARPAVDDVTLTIEPGEFVVLIGPSGCGKTTLLKLINRLYDATSGIISIDGAPLQEIAAPELRRHMGYVIQQGGLFPHYTVAENVAIVPGLLGWDKARTAARVDELLRLVGLPPEEYRERYPSQLSGGQQQRVGIARAVAAAPGTLLMDEPFGALDAITRSRLQEEVRDLHQQLGQTVVFVTHDIDEAALLADRIAVMREGRVLQYDTPLNVILRPADAFVAELVGADDILRRLSLVSVAAAMVELDAAEPVGPDEPVIDLPMRVRPALNLLLESGAPRVIVREGGVPVGYLDLPAVQAVSVPHVARDGA
ncbi:MAG: ABC transporter ATP-binding protein [Thermomicrobiales bacterium]|nr:ABC transporter ATP-binding protein [Thermomicrobiales bacterium]